MANREYYLRNRDRIIAAAKRRYLAKKAEINVYKHEWHRKNRDAICVKKREAYAANRDSEKVKSRLRYVANPDYFKVRSAAYQKQHPQNASAARKAWLKSNAARLAEMKLEWQRADYRANPEKYREIQSRRKAMKLKTRTERIDFKKILKDANGLCGICRKPFDLFGIDFDHIVPLARGGTHTADNIQATHARCNRAKGAKVV